MTTFCKFIICIYNYVDIIFLINIKFMIIFKKYKYTQVYNKLENKFIKYIQKYIYT